MIYLRKKYDNTNKGFSEIANHYSLYYLLLLLCKCSGFGGSDDVLTAQYLRLCGNIAQIKFIFLL